jgi:hypothetical protein
LKWKLLRLLLAEVVVDTDASDEKASDYTPEPNLLVERLLYDCRFWRNDQLWRHVLIIGCRWNIDILTRL